MIIKVQQKDFIIQNEIDDLKSRCKEIPGAITSFVGYVRDYSNGERITSLNIEHYICLDRNKNRYNQNHLLFLL